MAAAVGTYPLELRVTLQSPGAQSVEPIATASIDVPVRTTLTTEQGAAVVRVGGDGTAGSSLKTDIAATLRDIADDLDPRPTRLAREIVIDNRRGVVTIDGEELRFYLAAEPISAQLAGIAIGEMTVVHLPVAVDPEGRVELIHTNENDQP